MATACQPPPAGYCSRGQWAAITMPKLIITELSQSPNSHALAKLIVLVHLVERCVTDNGRRGRVSCYRI